MYIVAEHEISDLNTYCGTILLLACLFYAVTVEAAAQSASGTVGPVVIPRMDHPESFDGRVDDAAWTEALSLPVVQHSPNFGEEPTEQTEFLVGYTDDYLYVACRCYDSGSPTAPSFKRDYQALDTDYFWIVLDTFNDNENALAFATTPTGLRADFAINNDAAGDSPFDFDWNTFWDVVVHEGERGWSIEMRIPISSLRFQEQDGQVVMGFSAHRFTVRTNEIVSYPSISPEFGMWSAWKPSQAQEVLFEDLRPQRLLRVTPYVLGGAGQQSVLNGSGTAYELQTDPAYDAGLDVKYGLTSNLTLDLTINTDFAQVEADNQQVNLTRFPLFFPEKRQFFLERSSNFAFDVGGSDRLFYSRRIGLHEGEPVRILGGARLVGRSGPWDIGVLNMQTTSHRKVGLEGARPPAENFGVARLRRRVLNAYSYVGGIITSRIDMDGGYNLAYGLDGIFRVTGDEYLTAKWAQTFEEGTPNRLASLDAARILLLWERRTYSGINYDLSYSRSGEHYRPGLGFTLREDYTSLGDRIGYGWIPGGDSPLERHRLSMVSNVYFRNSDGSLQTLEIGPEWDFATNRGHSLTLGAKRRVEDLRQSFLISPEVSVPEGRHTFHDGTVSYSMPTNFRLRTDIRLTAGQFYDGRRGSFQLSPSWDPSRYVQLTGAYQLDRVVFSERDDSFTSHIGRVRIEVTPNIRYSLQGFVQYSSAGDVVVGNIRFRYNPREGNDLYLVYNEQLNTDRSHLVPRLPLSMGRTVLLKYTYTFGR